MRVTTQESIISYPHLFGDPKPPFPGNPPKFFATFVFLPGTDLRPLHQAVLEVAVKKFGPNAPQMFQDGVLRNPFGTDWRKKRYPEGSVYITAKANPDRRPGVVGAQIDPTTGKWRIITDPNEIYPGCIVRASVTAFAYDNKGRGVSFGLENVQKVRDGDRLDSRVSAEDEFDDTEPVVGDIGDLQSQAQAEAAFGQPLPAAPAAPAVPQAPSAAPAAPAPAANDLGSLFG